MGSPLRHRLRACARRVRIPLAAPCALVAAAVVAGLLCVGSAAAARCFGHTGQGLRGRAARVSVPNRGRGERAGMQAAGGIEAWFEGEGMKCNGFKGRGGSAWSSTGIMSTDRGDFFVKTASRPAKEMFEGEAVGLRAMAAAGGVKVPEVLHFGNSNQGSFIVMEKVDLGGRLDMREFGRRMAQMHLAEPDDPKAKEGHFGFAVHNTIGGTPQKNNWESSWPTFFREHRIGHQLKLARNSELKDIWKEVLRKTKNLESLFTDEPIRPSILHGDLWSGNYAGSPDGPVIFDPASYYGHHEAEWGMAWCAGFNSDFWEGYRELIPEGKQFRQRADLYEAYHKLNHYNLFGGGYLPDAKSLLRGLAR